MAVGIALLLRRDDRIPARRGLPRWTLVHRRERLVGNPPVYAAGDLLAMGDKRVDLEIAEPVEVGADARHLSLHDWMDRTGVLV